MNEPIDPALLLRRRIANALAFTALWLPFALFIALSMPMIGLWPREATTAIGIFALGGTFLLIWKNLRCGLEIAGRTGHTLRALPSTIAIFLLFTVVFVQILCHLGADHYRWRTLPNPQDWIAFTAAHAMRAGDVLDVIEEFQLDIQAIHHRSYFVAGVLVTFHLIMGVFVLSLVTEGISRFGRAIWRVKPFRTGLLILAIPLAIGGFIAAWSSLSQFSPVTQRDLLLWPVESIVRLVDVADVMVLFNFHFHDIPATPAVATLSILLRLVAGLLLLRWVHHWYLRISLRSFGGFGLSQRDLNASLPRMTNEQVRARIEHRLKRMQEEAESVRSPWYPLLWFILVAALCVTAFPRFANFWPAWDSSAVELAQSFPNPSAVAELRRMGPYAEDAIPVLTSDIDTKPVEEQRIILALLGHLGAKAGPTLDHFVNGNDSELAMIAANSIAATGVNGVPWMIWGLESPHAEVREILASQLRQDKNRTIPRMVEMLSLTTAPQLLPILESVDPYWAMRKGSSLFERVQTSNRAIELLQEREFPENQNPWGLLNQFVEVYDIGPVSEKALPAAPYFLKYIHDRPDDKSMPSINHKIWEMVRRLGVRSQPIVPELVVLLRQTSSQELPFYITTLDRIDPTWRKSDAAKQLFNESVVDLEDLDEVKRGAAVTMMFYFDEEAKSALPKVKKLSSENAVRLRELLECENDEAKLAWAKQHIETPETWIVLHRMGSRARKFAPIALKRLGAKSGIANADPELEFLARIGEPVVPNLIDMLADKRFHIRENATTILIAIGRPAIPELLKVAVSEDDNARAMAERILTDMHPFWRLRYGIEK